MVDPSVVVGRDLVGGLQPGTFAFGFVADDVTPGTLISNHADTSDVTVVVIDADAGADGSVLRVPVIPDHWHPVAALLRLQHGHRPEIKNRH